ncbi:MAG: DUF402 domain-containing protein [Dehalococcoidia bacterium]
MSAHPPLVLDGNTRTVTPRDGRVHALDEFVVGDGAVYFAWPGGPTPEFSYQERWLFPEQGWMAIRWTRTPESSPLGYDWYIDVDRIVTVPGGWEVHDRYLDVIVKESHSYEVLDADELADAVATGALGVYEALDTLRSLDRLCRTLRDHGFSVARLFESLAPGINTRR